MRTPVCPSSWNARIRCSGTPRPTWMSGDVTSIPSFTRSGRPRASFASSAPAGSTWTAFRVSSAIPMELGRLDVGRGDLAGRAAAEQCERVLGLLPEDLEHLRDSLCAAPGEPVHRGPSDENGTRTERERHHDVGPAAHASIHEDLRSIAHSLDDFGKRFERCDRAVELPPAVVRDDDAGCAVVARENRILGSYEALHDHRHLPALSELGHVVPLEPRLEQGERVMLLVVSPTRARGDDRRHVVLGRLEPGAGLAMT